jgi:hypothetical protein
MTGGDNGHPSSRNHAAPAAKLRRPRGNTEPWPIPEPEQERPVRWQVSWLAGRSLMQTFPDWRCAASRSSGRSFGRSPCIALTAYSCRDSCGLGAWPRTAFPFKPPKGHRRDHHGPTGARADCRRAKYPGCQLSRPRGRSSVVPLAKGVMLMRDPLATGLASGPLYGMMIATDDSPLS